jgi:hypothetical protein
MVFKNYLNTQSNFTKKNVKTLQQNSLKIDD